jgi:hypothetical protein
MKSLRVIDSAGNSEDCDVDEIPRIGELVMMEYGMGSDPVTQHYFRVKDVLYNVRGAPGRQAAILLDEETQMDWPS